MVWECWTSSSCECGELQNEAIRKVYPGAKSKHREAIFDSGVEERLQAWDGVIAGYSVRDITYYQDRVQAIAGIALQFDSHQVPPLAAPRGRAGENTLWHLVFPCGTAVVFAAHLP